VGAQAGLKNAGSPYRQRRLFSASAVNLCLYHHGIHQDSDIPMSIVDDALACLAKEVPSGSRLIVFGSQARGTADAESDLDLLVVEPAVGDRFAEMVRLSAALGRRLIPADVVVMSAESFERQKAVANTLAWRAAREGQVHEFAA
jgi:predicted nucleotidyltransferase